VPAEISLPQWGPGLAALLMLVLFRKDGHKIIFHAKGTPALRYLSAALIPAGAALVLCGSFFAAHPACAGVPHL
jgi:hypothetical protein